MKKEIIIDGMSCSHCSSRIEKALNSIKGISATVELNSKKAIVLGELDISDEILINCIEELGFSVVEIK